MTEEQSNNPSAGSRLQIQAALRTDVGRVRSENQDFGVLTTPEEEKKGHPGGRLFVVADGMGGHRGGATASKIAGETVKTQYLGSETTDVGTALRDSLSNANARIYSEAQANADLRGMGTTTSALAVRGNQAWFAHVGDSRIYMVRGEQIRQLTDDHSLVASMVREGLLTSKEAETHPRRNVLQRSMGVAEDVEIDVRGPFEIQPGDTFILCSDGLHGLVKEPELLQVAALQIEQAADEFLKRALERGAPDNVTVIVARVIAEAGYKSPAHLDETQPLSASGELLFDETQRDNSALAEAWRKAAPRSASTLPENGGLPASGATPAPGAASPDQAATVPAVLGADDTFRTIPAPGPFTLGPAADATMPSASPASAASEKSGGSTSSKLEPAADRTSAIDLTASTGTSLPPTLPGSVPAPQPVASSATVTSSDSAAALSRTATTEAGPPAVPLTSSPSASFPPTLPGTTPVSSIPILKDPLPDTPKGKPPAHHPGAAGTASRGGSSFRWIMVLLILLVIAGAWFFWTR